MNFIRKVWIAGANGNMGKAINAILNPLDTEILNTDIEDVDITDNQEVILFGDRNRPNIIINCAGMTGVENCEKNPEQAYRVNALGARNLAIAARKSGARMIHISTDDVFDGKADKPYSEFDAPNPQTVYGKSKLAGENFVKEFAQKHIIIRSSWIYGEKEGYLQSVLEAAKKGDAVKAASDQFATPTSAKELAKLVVMLMDTSEYGLYHAACEGHCSRYEFAKAIFEYIGKEPNVIPVNYGEQDNIETRPKYSVLDNFMLGISELYKMPDWRVALEEYLKEKK